jgi:hypothetical protein
MRSKSGLAPLKVACQVNAGSHARISMTRKVSYPVDRFIGLT